MVLARLDYASDDDPIFNTYHLFMRTLLADGAALGVALVMAKMVPEYRKTFFRHRTMKTHVREFHWNREPYMYNGEMQEQEKIRAEILTSYARFYWPMELVEAFVREGWARWPLP